MPQQLFIFKKILECNVDLPDITENYIEKLEADWLEFWAKRGEDIVHSSWSHKYSEFLLHKEVEDNQVINKELIEQTKGQPLDLGDDDSSWQELWDVHYTELYTKTYQLFEVVHYHQYIFYIPNIEDISETSSVLVEEETELNFHDQAEQLKALGLPTSFGGKYNKYDKSLQYSSSDFESDDGGVMPPVLQAENPPTEEKKKKKKKNRKLRKVPKVILQDKSLRTYWHKRFSLFSRFDEGIQLDRESWFSVTPEKVAIHMAERLRCDTIIDAFCGSGGNSIQFASTCSKVIAIDIDPEKIKNARHNAIIYGVADKIDFIIGDYLQLCDSLKGDVVFLSPPWGGPKYISKKEYDIEVSLLPVGASVLAEHSRKISENIVFFLPKNSIPQQIAKLAGIGNRVEIEHNYLDTRLVGLTAIYGDWLINKNNLSD